MDRRVETAMQYRLYTMTVMIAGAILLLPPSGEANFYKYRDSSGNLVITDNLENIPPKYRNSYKVVWDKDLEAKDPLAKRKAAARARLEKQEQEREQQRKNEKKLQPSDGKRLVITVDEETGQIIRRME
jgi:hypothetical protein